MNATLSMYDVYCVDVHTNKEKQWSHYPDGYAVVRLQSPDGDVTLALDFDGVKKLAEAISKKELS